MIKVLLADDHKIFLDGLLAVLKYEDNIEVVGTATEGETVMNIISHKEVNIVVLDINMPGLDKENPKSNGVDIARKIITDKPNIAVLILTMYNTKDFIFNLMDIGASGYILKNKSKEELVSAINKIGKNNGTYYGDEVMKIVIKAKREKKEEIQLTSREKEVLIKIGECLSSKEISAELHISTSTVETHIRNLLFKLDLPTRMHLVKYAIENGYQE